MAVELQRFAPGTFCWVELNTSDPVKARAYYEALFGWTSREMPVPEGDPYTLLKVGGLNVAAITRLSPEAEKMGAPSNWLNYIAVDDVDAATRKAQDLGAQIHAGPLDVMDAGRVTVLADPTGATFALWQGRNNPGAQLVHGEPGSFCWNELYTNDTAKAAAFYTGLFGYTTDTTDMGEAGTYTHFMSKDPVDPHEAGMYDPKQGLPPNWFPYFCVTDADATAQKGEELGGRILVPPTDIGAGRFALLQDGQGAVFGILKRASD